MVSSGHAVFYRAQMLVILVRLVYTNNGFDGLNYSLVKIFHYKFHFIKLHFFRRYSNGNSFSILIKFLLQ